MNRRELLIAQKAYQSRQVKNEMKLAKHRQVHTSPERSSRNGAVNFPNIFEDSTSVGSPPGSIFSPVKVNRGNSEEFTDFDDDDNSSVGGRGRAQTTMLSTSKSMSAIDDWQQSSMGSDEEADNWDELSQRSLTSQSKLRKTQVNVAKDLMQKGSGRLDDNRFMPKVSLLRADGSSLADIYQSKKEDAWGKIQLAQVYEADKKANAERKAKMEQAQRYGVNLMQQMKSNHQKMDEWRRQEDRFGRMEPQTTKILADNQKKRDEDFVNNRKQFIKHAHDDAQLCRSRREEEMRRDIEDSQVMVLQAKLLLAEDEKKKMLKKQHEAEMNAQLARENLENLARKSLERKKQHEEERRAVREAEKMHEEQEMRRKQEVERIQRKALGPVYEIAQKIASSKRLHNEKLYSSLLKAENSLNKQLKESEDAAYQRANANTAYLATDWEHQIAIHRKKHEEDIKRVEKIGEVMKKSIQDMENEDKRNRHKKYLAHKKFQQDLDQQVTQLRNRSIASLQDTMSVQEKRYNASLIRKAGLGTL